MKHLKLLLSAFLFLAVPLAQAADLTITPASFVPGARAQYLRGISGATITAGQVVVIHGTTGRYVLAKADDATLTKVAGIAAHAASAGQPLSIIVEDDDLTLGATLSMSAPIYVLSGTAGGIAPSADISVGEFPIPLLIAKSTTKCILKPRVLAGNVAAVAP